MKRRITPYQRQQQEELRQRTLALSQYYQRTLLNQRTKEIKQALGKLEETPYNKWVEQIPQILDEPYLPKYINSLYLNIGVPAARTQINNFLNRKADTDIWTQTIQNWLNVNAGKKVKIINESFKEWMSENLKSVLHDQTQSIEALTQTVYKEVLGRWDNVREWEIRRIVQTESLGALRTGGIESIKALNTPFVKTWVISGNNTRPAHQVMDGVTIDETELFLVDGEQMEYPGDSSQGASAGNIINCACTIIMTPK